MPCRLAARKTGWDESERRKEGELGMRLMVGAIVVMFCCAMWATARAVDPVLAEAIAAEVGASRELVMLRSGYVEERVTVRTEGLSDVASWIDADVLLTYRKGGDLMAVLADFRAKEPVVLGAYRIGTVAEIVDLAERLRISLGVRRLQQARAPRRNYRAIAVEAPLKAPLPEERRESAEEHWEGLSAALGSRLFPKSVEGRLATRKQLMVVPSGVISTLPLALLRPDGWRDLLGDRVSVSLLPSPGGDGFVKLHWTGLEGDRALVFGNPDLHRIEGWKFPDLPGAERDARGVMAILPGTLFLGSEATSRALSKHAFEPTILYMATHAVASDSDALDNSFIALADRLVSAREIQSMQFPNGALAVLSACQTGLGAVRDGGTIGLARAFQLAGFRGVIMSLWSVSDDATYQLMTGFLQNLKTLPPQIALQAAAVSFHSSETDPAKWAAFEYFGVPMNGPAVGTEE
jgi:hypothetical protein